VKLTQPQREVLCMVHDADRVVGTTAHTGGEQVAGNTAASLVKRGLLKHRPMGVTAAEVRTGFVNDWGVEITDEGRKVVAELREARRAAHR
jgi:hypothetical protein